MKAIVLVLAAAAIFYSVRQNAKGAEHPAISIARGFFWLALSSSVLIPHGGTTMLTVVGLLGLFLTRARYAVRSPESPAPPMEKPVKGREIPPVEFNPETREQFVRFRLSEAREFPIAGGSAVTLPAGEYEGRWSLRPVEDLEEETQLYFAPMESVLEFTAPDAKRWRVVSKLGAAKLLDLEYLADSASTPRAFVSERTTAQGDAFSNRCLAANLPVGNDGRSRFPLKIGSRTFCVMQKYLAWKVDLALSECSRRVLVLAKEVAAEKFSGDIFAAANPNDVKFLEYEDVPPFFYELPIESFLPLSNAAAHAGTVDSLIEEDDEFQVVLESVQ